MAIDTHVHFWKYNKKRDSWITDDMKILQQDYLPETISASFKRNGIDGCVAVQADQSELETHFLVELAKTHPIIMAVVGWIDLRADNINDRLAYFSQFPIIRGWRHIVQGEPVDFMHNKDFRRGLTAIQTYGYTYDILIYPHQLNPAIDLVKSFPDQPFVLDHCAKPIVRNKEIDQWKKEITELAALPNINCKLSGLLTEAKWKQWSPGDFYPYLDVIFQNFGVDRIMFGSDWPVILLSGMYVQWKSLIEKYMEEFNEDDREKVFTTNAQNFYRL